jgi:glycosyltransferase involved in cell wall biosynthesis
MPRFSVIIPCYNAHATLRETLASIIAQTFEDFEILCVDDGSSDETPEIIMAAAQQDTRIKLIRNTIKGPSGARNTGAKNARGDIFAFCDADDIWAPHKLAVNHAAFKAPNVDGVYGKIAFFNERPAHNDVRSTVKNAPITVPMLLAENPICTMSNLTIRAQVFHQLGDFDVNMVHNEDLEWLIRIIAKGAQITAIDDTLVWYRATPTGLSSDLTAMAKGRENAISTARRHGYFPSATSEAVHFRYLARRALRLDVGGYIALGLTARGIAHSPSGFIFPLRRGGATAIGALIAPLLPRFIRRALFTA